MTDYVYNKVLGKWEVEGSVIIELTELADIASQRILGRISSGTGNVEELPPASIKSILGYEEANNKVTDWSVTPLDTNYPSEKLVRDSLSALSAPDLSDYELLINKNNSVLNASSTEYPTSGLVKDELETVRAIAEGAHHAYVFADQAEMDTWLAVPANVATLNIGDNLYILDIETSDYWWNGTDVSELEADAVNLANLQPLSALLTAISALTPTAGQVITSSGGTSVAAKSIDLRTINTSTASYTFTSTDLNTVANNQPIRLMNVATANNATIPNDTTLGLGATLGQTIDFASIGAGQTTVVAGSGVTVNATPGLKLRARYSSATALRIAANTWLAIGDMAA